MSSSRQPATGPAKAGPTRSFLVGCGIAFVALSLAFVVLWVRGRARARDQRRATGTVLDALAAKLEERSRSARAPAARGLGADFSGQRALMEAGLLTPAPEGALISDAWGQPLRYRSESPAHFKLYSFGPNGRDDEGGFDDLLRQR
jgi:hypothetical protein